MNNRSTQLLVLLALSAATFLALLGRKDIVTSHEARVAQSARIMSVSGWPWNARAVTVPVVREQEIEGIKRLRPVPGGELMAVNPWLVPVINAQLRLQKPPLPYWCAAMVFRFAGVGEWQTRIVPAMLGAMGALLMFDLAAMLLGRRAAWIAGGVWLSTHFIVDQFRTATADPFLAIFTLACVWAWMRAARAGPKSFAMLLLFYASLAMGVLAKGPVIFATVAVPLVVLRVILRVRAGSWRTHLFGAILFLAIVVPWPLYILRHVPHAMDIWRYESVGEITGENVEKARPWWMYLATSFQLPLPWTVLWIGGFVMAFVHGKRGLKSPRGRRRMVAIAWLAVTIAFFSLSSVKKAAYLLPALPAQTLIVTDAIVLLLAFARRTRFRKMPGLVATAQAMIGVGFAGGMMWLLARSHVDRTFGIVCGIAALLSALLVFVPIAERRAQKWIVDQVVAYAVILAVLLGVQRPDDENRRSARPFAAALANYLPQSNLPLRVHELPEDLAFYLPLDLPQAGDSPYALLAVDHSPKDPPESMQRLSEILGDQRVIDARQVDLPGIDSNGRWRLFEITLDRSGMRS